MERSIEMPTGPCEYCWAARGEMPATDTGPVRFVCGTIWTPRNGWYISITCGRTCAERLRAMRGRVSDATNHCSVAIAFMPANREFAEQILALLGDETTTNERTDLE